MICTVFVVVTAMWQTKKNTVGETNRHATQFVAALIAKPLASGELTDLNQHLHQLPSDLLKNSTCVFDTAGKLIENFGHSTCPEKADGTLGETHLHARHPVRFDGKTIAHLVSYVPYSVLRQQVFEDALPVLIILLAVLAASILVGRCLARNVSRSIDGLMRQLENTSDQLPALTATPETPGEVQKLTVALNQRLTKLTVERQTAEHELERRRIAEQGERRARQLIRNIIDLVPYAIFAQGNDGTLIFANHAAAKLYDTTVDELLDEKFVRSLDPQDELLNSSKSEIVMPDGQRLEVTRTPFEGQNACLVVAIDTTEAYRLQTQLQFSQRLEVVGTLAGGIAHDFNNLLTPILGYASILADQDLPEDTLRQLKQIESAAEKARRVVQQMLAFSRQEPSEPRPVRLDNLLNDVAALMRVSAPTTVNIAVHGNLQTEILADPTQIEQVLINLCTNAVQSIGSSGGSIELHARTVDAPPAITGLPEGRYTAIEVTDDGPGIEPAILQHVFDPFFTTKEVGEGSGLGLSVAHGIMRNHGGELFVENRPSGGAAFTVLIPELSQPGAHPTPAP